MHRLKKLKLMGLVLLVIIGFQNCGEGFDVESADLESLCVPNNLNKNEVLAGDMILDTDSILSKGGRSNKNDGQQAATGFTIYQSTYWKDGIIPVEFNLTHPNKAARKQLFLEVCAEWGKHAYIECIPRTNETNYLYVHDTNNACNTHVGAGKNGGKRSFNFGLDWCWEWRPVLHDFGHVLGLMHEHQRPDRDSYVTIIEENIDPASAYVYDKFQTTETQSAYDFHSVMHYHPYAFSKAPNLAVMVPKPAYQNKFSIMGKYTNLSQLDIETIQKMYPVEGTPEPTPTPTPVQKANCKLDGQIIAHNAVVTAYKYKSVTAPATCISQNLRCLDGYFLGAPGYTYLSCTVVNPAPTPTPTPIPTLTPTPTPSPSPSPTPTPIPTVTPTPPPNTTPAPTPSPTPVPTVTPTPSPSPIPTATPTPAPTLTPTPTPATIC